MNNEKIRVISLFSGCGGMDLGFKGGFKFLGKDYKENNFEILLANDFSPYACKTYEHNFKTEIIVGDVKEIDEKEAPDCDLIIGGFPCQDFSLAGKRKGFNSERGKLYKQMLRFVSEKKPKLFIAENVEGLRIPKNGKNMLEVIMKEFKSVGYNVKYKLFNTAEYGVPQFRKRIIIVGVRNDIPVDFEYPLPICNSTNYTTAKDAIDDLWDKLGTDYVFNHSEKHYSKAKFIQGSKLQGNRRILPDEPSITIRAEHHGNIEAHYRTTLPDEEDVKGWRRLTVRECARIQSFPDSFVFPVNSSQAYRQIGNAVPPVFAWHLAQAVEFFFKKIKQFDK